MKILNIAFTIIVMTALCSIAQPPEGSPPDDHGGPWERGRMAPPGHEPASPLHKIMEDLGENDPEELARLEDLRLTDPKAFREEARVLVHSAALQKLETEKPEVYAAITQLNPDDQAWLLDSMIKSAMFGHHGKRWNKFDKARGDRKQVGKLIKQYKKSETGEEKKAIRAELKGYVSAQYDQRLEMRSEQIQGMMENINQIRQALKQAEQDKDRFVEEKVDQLLSGDWQGGRRRGQEPRE